MGRSCCANKLRRQEEEARERENRKNAAKVTLTPFKVGRPSDVLKTTYIPPDQVETSKSKGSFPLRRASPHFHSATSSVRVSRQNSLSFQSRLGDKKGHGRAHSSASIRNHTRSWSRGSAQSQPPLSYEDFKYQLLQMPTGSDAPATNRAFFLKSFNRFKYDTRSSLPVASHHLRLDESPRLNHSRASISSISPELKKKLAEGKASSPTRIPIRTPRRGHSTQSSLSWGPKNLTVSHNRCQSSSSCRTLLRTPSPLSSSMEILPQFRPKRHEPLGKTIDGEFRLGNFFIPPTSPPPRSSCQTMVGLGLASTFDSIPGCKSRSSSITSDHLSPYICDKDSPCCSHSDKSDSSDHITCCDYNSCEEESSLGTSIDAPCENSLLFRSHFTESINYHFSACSIPLPDEASKSCFEASCIPLPADQTEDCFLASCTPIPADRTVECFVPSCIPIPADQPYDCFEASCEPLPVDSPNECFEALCVPLPIENSIDCFQASCTPLPDIISDCFEATCLPLPVDQPRDCFLASCTPLPNDIPTECFVPSCIPIPGDQLHECFEASCKPLPVDLPAECFEATTMPLPDNHPEECFEASCALLPADTAFECFEASCISLPADDPTECFGASCITLPVDDLAECFEASCILIPADIPSECFEATCKELPADDPVECFEASCITLPVDDPKECFEAVCTMLPVDIPSECFEASCIALPADDIAECFEATCTHIPVENAYDCFEASCIELPANDLFECFEASCNPLPIDNPTECFEASCIEFPAEHVSECFEASWVPLPAENPSECFDASCMTLPVDNIAECFGASCVPLPAANKSGMDRFRKKDLQEINNPSAQRSELSPIMMLCHPTKPNKKRCGFSQESWDQMVFLMKLNLTIIGVYAGAFLACMSFSSEFDSKIALRLLSGVPTNLFHVFWEQSKTLFEYAFAFLGGILT